VTFSPISPVLPPARVDAPDVPEVRISDIAPMLHPTEPGRMGREGSFHAQFMDERTYRPRNVTGLARATSPAWTVQLVLKVQTADFAKSHVPEQGNLAHPTACPRENSCAAPKVSERKPTDSNMARMLITARACSGFTTRSIKDSAPNIPTGCQHTDMPE
jgi:hypothetical protein